MSRKDRRDLARRIRNRLQSAKAYCVITYDGENLPVYHFDLSGCENTKDLRHIAMHAAVEAAVSQLHKAEGVLAKRMFEMEQKDKVAAAKEARSAELAGACTTDSAGMAAMVEALDPEPVSEDDDDGDDGDDDIGDAKGPSSLVLPFAAPV